MAKVNIVARCNAKASTFGLGELQVWLMPPDELCYLTNLQYVEVLNPDPKLAKILQQLQKRDRCKLHVYHLDSTN